MVNITVMKLNRASCQQNTSITAIVPMIIMTLEKSDDSDWDMVLETLSMSLVIRLMMSPWEWLST